jgi:hypothetical protein
VCVVVGVEYGTGEDLGGFGEVFEGVDVDGVCGGGWVVSVMRSRYGAMVFSMGLVLGVRGLRWRWRAVVVARIMDERAVNAVASLLRPLSCSL